MEEWKPVVGFEDRYDVSNFGNVRTSINSPHRNARIHLGKMIKPKLEKSGYLRLHLNFDGERKFFFVHTIVLNAFSGPRPPGFVARHLDGNRINNASHNLEWSTQKDNLQDRIKHGTHNKGERHPNAVLTNVDVLEMRRMKLMGVSNVKIAECFLVTPTNVGYIVRNKSWTHV